MWLLLLNAASAAPDPVRDARDAAARSGPYPGPLVPVAVVPQGDRGTVVQLRPERDGVPVDLEVNVRLGPDGAVRRIVADPVPTRRLEGAPMDARRARSLVLDQLPADQARARLSWQAEHGALRQVWTVEVDRPSHGLRVPRMRLDAVTGAVLSLDDAASFVPFARAWENNPVVDLRPVVVPLPLATDGLSDARLTVYQCRDIGETVEWKVDDGTIDVHRCSRRAVSGPIGGSWLFEPVPWPLVPARDEDAFAGPHVYWNVHQGLDWFEDLGWVPADDFEPHLEVTVNQRDPNLWSQRTATDPDGLLEPLDNAYASGGWRDADGEWVSAALVFGQGSEIDFGYDADVVHHELGHYIVRSVHGPSSSDDGPYGPSVRGSTLNEGLADYFSAAIHGDPAVAEYAGGSDRTSIRDLSGTDSCATDLYGESHYDSLPFSQPLWQLRETLTEAERWLLDQAVLDSLPVMGTRPDFDTATEIIGELVRERLGDGIADDLAARWRERGALDCPPILDIVPSGESFRRFALLKGSYASGTWGPIPGYLQYRVEIPPGGARLTLRFDQPESLGLDLYGDNLPHPIGVVGRSGGSLTWSWVDHPVKLPDAWGNLRPTVVDEWVSDGREVGTSADVAQRPTESGLDLLHTHVVTWDVADAGPWVFQLTNGWPRSATIYSPTLTMGPLPAPVAPPAPEGCGCDTGPGGPALGAVLLVSFLGIRRRTPSARVRTAPDLNGRSAAPRRLHRSG